MASRAKDRSRPKHLFQKMKKIKLNTARLQLKKDQVTALTNLENVQGGDGLGLGNEAFLSIFGCKSKKKMCVSTTPNPDPTESRSPDTCWSYDIANTCN